MRPASSRNLRLTASLALLSLAAACTSPEWIKSDSSPDDAQGDYQECMARAWREAEMPTPRTPPPPVVSVTPGPGGAPNVSVIQPPSASPAEGWSTEQRRYAAACMREKGYLLAPAR